METNVSSEEVYTEFKKWKKEKLSYKELRVYLSTENINKLKQQDKKVITND